MAGELETDQRPVSPVGRVSQSLLRRRWPEFFVEFILIIVGILAALAIDGWMQDRQDRKSEVAYLELLRQDLIQIEETLQRFVDFETANLQNSAATYNAIAAKNLPGDVSELRKLIGGLSTRRTLRIVSGAYTDLTSTGNLQLIRSQDLREKMLRFFAESARVELVIEKNNTAFIDGMFYRFLADEGITAIWSPSPEEIVSAADALALRALGDEFEMPADTVLRRAPGDPGWDNIRRHVLLRTRVAAVGAVIGGERIEAARELRAEIEAELQNPI